MKRLIQLLILSSIICTHGLAQQAVITGTVREANSNKRLENVIIKVGETGLSTKSEADGAYLLTKVPAGKYYLQCIKTGYYSLIIPDITVPGEGSVRLDIELYPGDEKEYLFLEIGGIHVTAERELLSEEPETVHRISSGEIEHMQANSLADVLDMIPGNEKTEHLGLQRKQSIRLRTFGNAGDDQAALFGTKIIVDDVPLTNNADLQSGIGVGYGSLVENTAGVQYDLREVVAENLEKVEVLPGASSVEYGDQTQGVILVKTRTRNVPTRFKLKNNPDTREANLMGSVAVPGTDLVYNLNYGYSERDIRVAGDEYHRIQASIKSSNWFWDRRLAFNQSFSYKRKLEEDNDPSDTYGVKAYNRDHHLTYSHQIDYKWNEVSRFYLRNYVDYKRRNSWKQKLETTDHTFGTDLMEPGIREAVEIPPSYTSQVRTIGHEWSYGSKLKTERKWFSGPLLHRSLFGLEFQADANTGPGKTYDLLKPPNGKLRTRPRSFSDIPGIYQLAVFAEDRLTGTLIFPVTLDLGFRLDSYNPASFKPANLFKNEDVFEAGQGTFFNPRLGLKLKLQPRTQLRLSFSRSSKTPPLSSIYPEDFYLDIEDHTEYYKPVAGGVDTVRNLLRTKIYKRSSKGLRGYQSTKFEAALDRQFGDVGFSLAAYRQKTTGIPRAVDIPFIYQTYFWPNWPSLDEGVPEKTVTTINRSYDRSINVGWSESRGLEFSLRTHRIKALNMRFRLNGAFTYKKYGSKHYATYGSTVFLTRGDTLTSGWVVPEDMQIIPYYRPYESWRQNTVINYAVDYIARSLGIWFTLKAQQVLWDYDLEAKKPKVSADGYFRNGQNVPVDPGTSRKMGLDRSFTALSTTVDRSRPNDNWYFSIVASKSLFSGAEISLFVENVLNDRAWYKDRNGYYRTRNPEIFWGIAFSSKLDNLFNNPTSRRQR